LKVTLPEPVLIRQNDELTSATIKRVSRVSRALSRARYQYDMAGLRNGRTVEAGQESARRFRV
jgi:hypothetical protein